MNQGPKPGVWTIFNEGLVVVRVEVAERDVWWCWRKEQKARLVQLEWQVRLRLAEDARVRGAIQERDEPGRLVRCWLSRRG